MKRQPRRRFLLRWVLPLLLLSSWSSSCDLSPQLGAPTLPLPPPGITRQGDRYTFSGSVPVPDANVLARNERTRLIFGERAVSRLYSFPVDAEEGDFFTMWYTIGLQQSSPTIVEIPALELPDAELPDAELPDAGAP